MLAFKQQILHNDVEIFQSLLSHPYLTHLLGQQYSGNHTMLNIRVLKNIMKIWCIDLQPHICLKMQITVLVIHV